MKTPSQFALSRLTRELYVEFLERAKARGFAFVRYSDLRPGGPALPPRYIALRHDVDFAPEYALAMAELEHAAGVASTFFVLVDGQFYNPLDSAASMRSDTRWGCTSRWAPRFMPTPERRSASG
jgi:hypothetical protein